MWFYLFKILFHQTLGIVVYSHYTTIGILKKGESRNNNNAFHAASECRRQVKNDTNIVKNVKIVEFHDHIWNHHEKYIEILVQTCLELVQ